MISPVFLASLKVGVETLRANPLRTLLSTLGVIMGVAALVSVLSLGDGERERENGRGPETLHSSRPRGVVT